MCSTPAKMVEKTRNVPHIALTINEDEINVGALRILSQIRPEWNPEGLEFKLLTDGITNKLVGCLPKNANVADTVLVRVYGNKTDLLIDRKAETRNITILSEIDLAPELYATFANGLAYRFVPGCTLDDGSVRNPEIYRLVAVRMAKLHKVRVPGENNPEPFIWGKIQRFFDLVPDRFSDAAKHKRYGEIAPPKSRIRAEIDRLRSSLAIIDSPVVFCHNDLLLGNVVYTKENNSVTFIDYEYAAYNYQAFDIANHFLEFAGVENVDYDKYPEKELQLAWMRIYLEEYLGEYSERDVNTLFCQVNKFTLVSHLFWGIWALIQTEHSYIDFDFLGYAAIRFNEYFAKRDAVLALEIPS